MSPWNDEWLELTKEDPLDPDLPICDAHHHLYEKPTGRYLFEEFLADIRGGHRIVKSVFVECQTNYRKGGPEEMQPVGETEFVQGVNARSTSGQSGETNMCAGIVGAANLALGKAVEPVLEAHIEAGKGSFRGIRHQTCWDPHPSVLNQDKLVPPKLLLDSKFREGIACLQKLGLSYDAWCFFHQLMEVVDLARAFPDLNIIMEHTGGPIRVGYEEKYDEVLQQWKQGIAALGTCPNVSIKLGAIGSSPSRRYAFGWDKRATPPDSTELAEVMSPYFLECIEQFGADRCMFESNFPADKPSYSYNVIWNTFKRITKSFSSDERAALFRDTASRVYRI
ncbi:amidohydrolase family protein [Chloroflexota bacterium]